MALNYSRLGFTGNEEHKSWNNITLSPTTIGQRKQIKNGMDDFTSFKWRGVDAFDVFGAFIINNKNTLKFYNGPTFSNEYTKPQFESAAGQLVGVSFNVQKIDFTIGVYWISEDDYRKLIDWLNPYEINTLSFGFEPQYYYIVKLASVGDALRHVVGSEMVNGQKEYRYYTEMKLTFEVQGDPCAYRKIQYEFKGTGRTTGDYSDMQNYTYSYSLKDNISDNDFKSQLAMPFKYKMRIGLKTAISSSNRQCYFDEVLTHMEDYQEINCFFDIYSNGRYERCNAISYEEDFVEYYNVDRSEWVTVYEDGQWVDEEFRTIEFDSSHPINITEYPFLLYNLYTIVTPGSATQEPIVNLLKNLKDVSLYLEGNTYYNNFLDARVFYVTLKNLSFDDLTQEGDNYFLDIIYDSATGLLYWDRNDSKLFLLSRLSTGSTGSRIVDTLNSTSYKVLGTFDNWDFDISQWKLELKLSCTSDLTDPHLENSNNYYIEMRARTNLI